jgi:soluble lytic murein transglycosylase-like protein
VIGPRSQAAYAAASSVVKSSIVQLGRVYGFSDDAFSRAPPVPTATPAIIARIREVAAEQGVNPDLAIEIVRRESNFNVGVTSPTGASGLFQLTGPAIRQIGIPVPATGRNDVEWNIQVGVRYLRYAISTAARLGFPPTAWAAYGVYNVGPGTMRELRAGNYTEAVKAVVRVQASYLSAGGAPNYLSNLERSFA